MGDGPLQGTPSGTERARPGPVLRPAGTERSPTPPADDAERARRLRRRRAGQWARRGVWMLLALALAAGIVVAMVPERIPVETEPVRRGPLRVVVDEDGMTRVADKYVLAAPQTGTLLRVGVRPGDRVREGEVVARLLPPAPPLLDVRTRAEAEARVAAAKASVARAQASIELSRAALELAQTEAARMRQLVQNGAATRQELDRAEAQLRSQTAELRAARFAELVARNDLRQAEAALQRLSGGGRREDVTVTSPVAGTVLHVARESEGPVQAGEPLVTVGDPQSLEIVVDVLTAEAVEVRPGQKVVIERWGGPQALEGRVRKVEPAAFAKTSALGVEEQRVNVVVDLLASEEQRQALGDGYRVEAKIVVWEGADVLQVPTSAVFRRDREWAVFVVAGGVARERRVQLGRTGETANEVREGLKAGETVVVYPSDRLADGARVRPK